MSQEKCAAPRKRPNSRDHHINMGKTSPTRMMLKVASLARKIQNDPSIAEDTPARLNIYREAHKLTHKWLDMAEAELRSHGPVIASKDGSGGRERVKRSTISMLGRIGTMALKALGWRRGEWRDAASMELVVETCNLLRLFLEDAGQEVERLERHLGPAVGRGDRSRPIDDVRPHTRKQSAANPPSKHADSAKVSRNTRHYTDDDDDDDDDGQGTDHIVRVREISDIGSKNERRTVARTIASISSRVTSQGGGATGEGQRVKQGLRANSKIAMPVQSAKSHLSGWSKPDSIAPVAPSPAQHHRGPSSSSATVASSRKTESAKAAPPKNASKASSLGISAPAVPSEQDRTSVIESTHSACDAQSPRAGKARSKGPSHTSVHEAESIRSRVTQAGATPAPAHSQASRPASVDTRSHAQVPQTSSEASNATAVPITSKAGTQVPAPPSVHDRSNAGDSKAKAASRAASHAAKSRATKAESASRAVSHNTSPSVQQQMKAVGPASSARPPTRAASRAQSAAKLTAGNLAEMASQASSSARSSKTGRHGRESLVKGSAAAVAHPGHGAESGHGQSDSVYSEIDMGFARPKRPLKCHHVDDEDNPKPEDCDSVAGTDSTVP
ncbi:hypothetical protein EJ03DRAFT_175908 [Teratosphaeria nubilosa]|uniref:Uncharacterized protein n=1 Tax=Teratosphaeria nubilosa TaxID=161662 RepID=A0A6G1L103_9PEZI|nr:hypothetical protein EJ03DRAFT_175908 [Teratosphaeria nubilosa]